MIRNKWLGLVRFADDSRVSRTCDRRHVSFSSGGGSSGSLICIVALTFCYVTVTCGDSKDRTPRGIKELQLALSKPGSLGECDLEPSCDWRWNKTGGFVVMQAPARSKFGPTTDANNTKDGKETRSHGFSLGF